MELDRVLFTKNWLFALTEDEAACQPDYDDSAFRAVTLPHDWQIEQPRTPDAPGGAAQGYFPREHVGVYRLHFSTDKAWQGKVVRVLFDGVQRFSQVWLNGKKVGGHAYGYVPFLCDLTDALDFDGDNILAVKVDNRTVAGEYASSGDRWYSGAGIYRNVWLLMDEKTHIVHDGVRVTAMPLHKGPSGDVPDVAGIQCAEAAATVTAEIEGDGAGMEAELTVFNPEEEIIYRKAIPAEKVTTWEFTIAKPALWSPDSPSLYSARVTLGSDAQQVTFGVRSAVFDTEEGFLLNGVKTKLWGVNLHHDGGAVGAAVPIEIWVRRLKALKRMGVNTIRCSHNPQAEEFYDLCDQMGFMVVDEYCDKWEGCGMYFSRVWDDHREDLAAMIRRDGNHPCVILWSVGNEVSHQYSEKFYACLQELVDETRRLDPTRATTAALIGFYLKDYNDVTPLGKKLAALKRYADIVDVVSVNYMEHFYEKMREYGIRNPIIGSEVHMLYRFDEKTMNSVGVSAESSYEIVKKYDWVCGALVWAGIDYLGESTGWPWRGWTGNPLDSTGDWKLRAWYCASHFKQEPVMKLCVYDESEPWDGARGAWGFPQMRAHWKYNQFEKMMHVAVMTNCDTVRLYQNSQTVRVGYRKDFPDGMVHFTLPYIPGLLRAEGYIGGMKVCEDALTSDHGAHSLRVAADRMQMPADGRSAAMIDLIIEDAHGRRYALENRKVTVRACGAPVRILMDNGDASCVGSFARAQQETFNGHLLVLLLAGCEAGETKITLDVEGFGEREIALMLT